MVRLGTSLLSADADRNTELLRAIEERRARSKGTYLPLFFDSFLASFVRGWRPLFLFGFEPGQQAARSYCRPENIPTRDACSSTLMPPTTITIPKATPR